MTTRADLLALLHDLQVAGQAVVPVGNTRHPHLVVLAGDAPSSAVSRIIGARLGLSEPQQTGVAAAIRLGHQRHVGGPGGEFLTVIPVSGATFTELADKWANRLVVREAGRTDARWWLNRREVSETIRSHAGEAAATRSHRLDLVRDAPVLGRVEPLRPLVEAAAQAGLTGRGYVTPIGIGIVTSAGALSAERWTRALQEHHQGFQAPEASAALDHIHRAVSVGHTRVAAGPTLELATTDGIGLDRCAEAARDRTLHVGAVHDILNQRRAESRGTGLMRGPHTSGVVVGHGPADPPAPQRTHHHVVPRGPAVTMRRVPA